MSSNRRFRIGHFPQYTANPQLREDLKWIKNLEVISGGLTEMAKRRDDVQAILGPDENATKVFWDDHGGRPIEIPMFIDKAKTAREDFTYIPISPGIDGVSFVKPRGISFLTYVNEEGDKIAHIHTHWDAALQNRETGEVFSSATRVRFARENSEQIERLAKRLKGQGYAVFITGDFNYRNFSKLERFRLWKHSPQKLFSRVGLRWKAERLDYFAWDSKKVRLMGMQVVPAGSRGNHGDHPYMIGSFDWAA